jgi:hypothetical protein
MKWLSTPSHAYLKVKREEVHKTLFRPSSYSFENTAFYFLEEDVDAPEYLKSLYGKDWRTEYVKADIKEQYFDGHIEEII